MSDKLRRTKDKASALFAKGRYDKALIAWQEVVKADPRDLSSRLRLGDAYRRLEQNQHAMACYREVADFYARDGLLLKAIAVCKLILEVDDAHTDTQELLAELYSRKYGHPRADPVNVGTAQERPPEAPPPPPPEAFGDGEGAGVELPVDGDEPFQVEFGADEEGEEEIDLDALGDEPIDVSGMTPPAPPPPPEIRELPVIPLFSDLEYDAFVSLMSRMRLRRLLPADPVVREGEKGDAFYVVASGQLRVSRRVDGEEVELARLTDGHFFGEMALLSDTPRTATVIADTEAEVFELDRQLLDELVAAHPAVEQALQRFYRQRLLSNLMATSPLFRPFEKEERRSLVQRFNAIENEPGEVIVQEGRPSGGLYVLVSGEVAVTRGSGFEELTLARLSEGGVFGEMSLLTREPATATVRALRRCVMLRLPTAVFGELMMTHPQILEVIAELTDARTRENALMLSAADLDEGALLM